MTSNSVIIGFNTGITRPGQTIGSNVTLIGPELPMPETDHTMRIGSRSIYLEINPHGASVSGTTDTNTAVREVLAGMDHAADLIADTIACTIRACVISPDALRDIMEQCNGDYERMAVWIAQIQSRSMLR
jgi:hypothetical protein